MLYTILTSNNPKFFYYKLLLFITIIAVIYYIYRASEPPKKSKENFTQDAPFLLKTNLDVYDQFYAEVYDGITEREKSCQRELYQIIKMTNPDTKNSVFLDIGSGTGCVVNELTQAGYTAYGVDQSEAMVDISEAKYPEIEIFQRNVTDAMCFDKGLFTHILCTNFTIYELKDKNIFFRNCYHWLKPNGYLVVHLVDREKFSAKKFEDSIMDLSALYRTIWPSTTNNKENNKKTSAEFIDYVYEAVYETSTTSPNVVILKETFTDKETKHIRQNENILMMESIEEILSIASKNGFIIQGKTNKCSKDENQYLYIFERTM